MKPNWWKLARALIFIFVCALGARFVVKFQERQQWFEIQRQQLAMIDRIADIPPRSCSDHGWRETIITTYNVWGNTIHHPDHSKISNGEMHSLLAKLEQIVAQTTAENSYENVDRVYQLLLDRGRKVDFISSYHDNFRKSCRPFFSSPKVDASQN